MNNFEALVSKIERIGKNKPHVIVGITGFGGSGKSYLSDRLRDYFGIDDNQIVRIDNLYGPNPRGSSIFDQSDWELIESILKASSAGKRLEYQGKDYKGKILYFDEDLPEIVIFEGIRLLQPKFNKYFDFQVWIDCPQDFAIKRAKERDLSQGENEERVAMWDTDWGPKDKKYFDTYRPARLAALRYTAYK